MPALAAAVTPIMKLLVVVDTLNGMRITWSIASTLNAPDPIPNRPESVPAPNIMPNPEGILRTWYALIPVSDGYVESIFRRVASGSGGWLPGGTPGPRRDRSAETTSTPPKIPPINTVGSRTARDAPSNAPIV